VPIAVVTLAFDPFLHLSDGVVVRWQTIALALIIVAVLTVAGTMARRAGLRPDDLLFVIVGVVPGAVLGGRVGYAFLHLDYYGSNPGALLDPTGGGLELGLGVVGGVLTGAYVARLLRAPVARWLHLLSVPLLVALGAGKLAMVLGGAGQGQPSIQPWATAFAGPGPWASLAPAFAASPSQIYEGVAILLIAVIVTLLLIGGAFPVRDGRPFLLGVAAWAIARAVVSLTWRDQQLLGPANVGTILAIAIAIGSLVVLVGETRRLRVVDEPA
jgi:prolipoprotein diacylglyceryltransferase